MTTHAGLVEAGFLLIASRLVPSQLGYKRLAEQEAACRDLVPPCHVVPRRPRHAGCPASSPAPGSTSTRSVPSLPIPAAPSPAIPPLTPSATPTATAPISRLSSTSTTSSASSPASPPPTPTLTATRIPPSRPRLHLLPGRIRGRMPLAARALADELLALTPAARSSTSPTSSMPSAPIAPTGAPWPRGSPLHHEQACRRLVRPRALRRLRRSCRPPLRRATRRRACSL